MLWGIREQDHPVGEFPSSLPHGLTASLGIRLQIGSSPLCHALRNSQDEQAHQMSMSVLLPHTDPELFGLSHPALEAVRPASAACPLLGSQRVLAWARVSV
jgi:hypothetical protein